MKNISRIAAALAAVFLLLSAASCNKQIFDTTYHFDYAYIGLPNGDCVEGRVESWTDFEDGDQLQIKIDGTWYLVHAANAVLISGRK